MASNRETQVLDACPGTALNDPARAPIPDQRPAAQEAETKLSPGPHRVVFALTGDNSREDSSGATDQYHVAEQDGLYDGGIRQWIRR